MEREIEKKLKLGLSKAEKAFKNDSIANEFEKSSKHFNSLVKKGIVKKRGNQLLSISDKNATQRIFFNR